MKNNKMIKPKNVTFEDVMKTAKLILSNSGVHFSQIIYQENGKWTYGVFQINNDTRDMMRDMVKEMIEKSSANKYFLVMESWVKILNKKNPEPFKPARECSDKRQALIVMEHNKDMTNKMATIYFTKDAKGKVYFEEETIENNPKNFNSFWNVYLEKEGHIERSNKIVSEVNKEFLKHISKEFTREFFPRFMKYKQGTEDEAKLKEDIVNWIEKKKEEKR